MIDCAVLLYIQPLFQRQEHARYIDNIHTRGAILRRGTVQVREKSTGIQYIHPYECYDYVDEIWEYSSM